MKLFHCTACQQIIYFENHTCTHCGRLLGFCPDDNAHFAFDPAGNGLWKKISPGGAGKQYRQCLHYYRENTCNWMIPENTDPDNAFCLSCSFNKVIPDLSHAKYKEYWHQLEIAKRRLLYTLISLRLPLKNKHEDPPQGLAFAFLAGPKLNPREYRPVLTGHDRGLITINIAEADDARREKMRLDMNERYRTLLGHFRHEIGHYYWFLLVQDSRYLQPFRDLFGDETLAYEASLNQYYGRKEDTSWQLSYVSKYASSHPWEDWAETWAHYLHMVDTLETTRSWGLKLEGGEAAHFNSLSEKSSPSISGSFEETYEQWVRVACALNSFNRSMGMKDLYPFVLSRQAVNKLRFIHDLIQDCGNNSPKLRA